jgi:HAD superfamily hydrolase (TIGR01490 family)
MTQASQGRLALFDLDNTLIPIDSDVAWAQHLVGLGVVERDWYSRRNDYFYEQYKAGTLDIHEFLDFQLAPLAAHPPEQLLAWREAFMAERIRPHLTKAAQALVEEHLKAGDLVAIVTATNTFITAPIAEAFGIAHLIGTDLEQTPEGRFTGKPRGLPCFQAGKIVRVAQWLATRDTAIEEFETSFFYSDSRNDLPLLGRVTHPVAVNPDATLEAHAKAEGWPVILLPSNL